MIKQKEEMDWFCIDCGIYCGQKRYFRNLKRCSKCITLFKRRLARKNLNSGKSS